MINHPAIYLYPEYYYKINEHNHQYNLCSNLKFNDKFEALKFAKTIENSEVFLNWFDNIWQKTDYTKEPILSLSELKKQRALKIRDNYKYVKLWFSGGVDSISALNTFLYNGIHIDEIAYWSRPINNWKHVDPDNEIKAAVEPYLKNIKHLIPNTKIIGYQMNMQTVIDKTKNLYELGTSAIKLGAAAELDITPEARDLYLTTQMHDDCVNLEGGSKPALAKIDNQWYFFIRDDILGLKKHAEDFFFDPEDPTLYIKTLHTFSKYIDSLNYSDHQLTEYAANINKLENKLNFLPHIGRERSLHDVAMIKHVFSGSAVPCIQVDDALRINFFYIRNAEVVRAIKSNDEMKKVFDMWRQVIGNFNDEFSDHVVKRNGVPDVARGFKSIYSKFYCLHDSKKFKWRITNPINKSLPNTVFDKEIIKIIPS